MAASATSFPVAQNTTTLTDGFQAIAPAIAASRVSFQLSKDHVQTL